MKNGSVLIAKDRLKSLIVSDRVNCTPDTFEKIYIYDTKTYELVTKIAVPGNCVNARLIKNQLYVFIMYTKN